MAINALYLLNKHIVRILRQFLSFSSIINYFINCYYLSNYLNFNRNYLNHQY